MPIQEKDVVWIEEPELSFWEQTFLPAVAGGLKVAVKHTVEQHSVTQQFPEEKPDLPLNPCRIYVGETTKDLIGRAFKTVSVGTVSLKGKDERIAAFQVLGAAESK